MTRVRRYRKKPVVIEAMRFVGGRESAHEVKAFAGDSFICWWFNHDTIGIETLEGTMHAKPGDWIIKGVAGEFYPCKPDIFEATYEPVEDYDAEAHAACYARAGL